MPEPKLDYNDIIELASMKGSGHSIQEIAEHFGVHRSTVHTYLDDMGLVDRAEGGGPMRRDTCAQGHSMEDAREKPDGGRECRKCKQRRDREYQKRRYWAKKQAGG